MLQTAVGHPGSVGRERGIARLAEGERHVRVRRIREIYLRGAPVLDSRECVLLFGVERRFIDVERRGRESGVGCGIGLEGVPQHQLAPAGVVADERQAFSVGGEYWIARVVYDNAGDN